MLFITLLFDRLEADDDLVTKATVVGAAIAVTNKAVVTFEDIIIVPFLSELDTIFGKLVQVLEPLFLPFKLMYNLTNLHSVDEKNSSVLYKKGEEIYLVT